MGLSVKPLATSVTKYVIPEHLRNDSNSNLLKFLEHYYIWMAQEGNPLDFLQNILEYREFDVNPQMFSKLLEDNTAPFLPRNSTINKEIITAFIKDFYLSKGTLPSYEFVMNALFGEHCSVESNSYKVFRASSNNTQRRAFMAVFTDMPWHDSVIGSSITQDNPIATAKIENCISISHSGNYINYLELAPETVVGTFNANKTVKVLNKTIDRAWFYVDKYFYLSAFDANAETISLTTTNEISTQYKDLVIRQVGSNFRAVITSLMSRIINHNYALLKFKIESISGTANNTGRYYIIHQSIENNHYNESAWFFGVVSPTISKIKILNGGAMHDIGEHVEYYGGTGTEFKAKIHDVGGGKVDEIKIYQKGFGYSVGDSITVDESEAEGTGLSAIVSAIDGIGAVITPTMELDTFSIKEGGDGYALNDVVIVRGGTGEPITLTVNGISTSQEIFATNITNGGMGYIYCNIKAYLTGTFNPPSETITFIPTIVGGIITACAVKTPVDLSNPAISIAVNGFGATATATVNTGAVNAAFVVDSGFNYIAPIVVVTGVGTGAVLVANMDAYGRITSIDVINGGTGYTSPPTLAIKETYGSGAVIAPILRLDGSVSSLSIVNRGAYSAVPSPFVCKPYNSGVAQVGNGLEIDMTYRIKSIALTKAGEYYKQIAFDTSYGLGHGAILIPQIFNGVVTNVGILTAGSGYTRAQIGIIGTGAGFKGLVSLSGGAVTGISILDGGYGYSITDTVVIYGDGTNATCNLTISDGTVKQMVVQNGGSGYPYNTTVTYEMNPSVVGAVPGVFTPVIVDGVIKEIVVVDGGSGYFESTMMLLAENTNMLTTEDGFHINFDSNYDVPKISSGNKAIITASIAGNGGLLSVELASGGTGYYNASEVKPLKITVSSLTGLGAVLIPTLENGNITKVDVIHGGSGYVDGDTIIVTGEGNGAVLTPVFSHGRLINVIVENGGTDYQYGTIVHIIGNGRGAEVEANVFTGISSIDVLDTGHTYTNPSYILSDPKGSGAVLRVAVSIEGKITDVHVLEPGKNYVNPTLQLTDANGAGATFKVNIKRNIQSLKIVQQGRDYSHGRMIIIGDGEDAEGTCKFEKNGSIGSIQLNSQGSGYTRVPVIGIYDISNYGAVSRVKVLNGGANYTSFPLVSLPTKFNLQDAIIAGGCDLAAFGSKIGHIRGIEFESFGALWHEIPKVKFPLHVVVDENSNFAIGEVVKIERFPYTEADNLFDIETEDGDVIIFEFKGDPLDFLTEAGENICEENIGDLEQEFDEVEHDVGPTGTIYALDFSRKIVEMMNVSDELIFVCEDGKYLTSETRLNIADQASNTIGIGDTLIGVDTNARATIAWMAPASGIAVQGGFGFTEKKSVDDVGRLNHPNSLIHNSERIQDFAYVIKSNLSFKDYVNQMTQLVHPAGYKMFGDVVSQRVVSIPKISTPSMYGVSGGDTSMSVNLDIATEHVHMIEHQAKGLYWYNATLGKWHTTHGGLFGNYSFNNFDINSLEYISSNPKISDIEMSVSKTWEDISASVTAESGTISSITTSGINIGYKVFAYDSNNTPIFRDNRVKMEDGFFLMWEDSVDMTVTNLCTQEDEVFVEQILNGTSILASKNSSITDTVTCVIMNTPDLMLS